MRIARYRNTRYWAVIDTEDTLVCLCVYRKGALEVVRRLEARDNSLTGRQSLRALPSSLLPLYLTELSSWTP